MNEYQELQYEESHTVTPEEAVNNLVAAIILEGVLEYRRLLINNLTKNADGYYIRASSGIRELEKFFDLIGFKPYSRLYDGVLSFQKEIIKDPNRDSFICPICKGHVHSKLMKTRSKFAAYDMERRYTCDGCQIKMVRPIPREKG